MSQDRQEGTENVVVVTQSDEHEDTTILGVYTDADDAKAHVREEAAEYSPAYPPDPDPREWVTDDEDHLLTVKKARRAFVARRHPVE